MTRILLFAGLLSFAGIAAASDPVPTSTPLQLEAMMGGQSGQCLQSPMAFDLQGHQMRTADCLSVGSLQMFTFLPQAGGGYRIVNANTGGCVDVEGLAMHAGARIMDWACHGGANQTWDIVVDEVILGKYAYLQSRQSGMCLAMQDGVAVQTACNPAALEGAAWWVYDEARAGRDFHLQVQGSGLCMSDDKMPTLRNCDHRAEYEFTTRDPLGDKFLIRHYEQGYCLQMSPNSADPSHTYVSNAPCLAYNGPADLEWRLVPSGTQWLIQNVGTGKCLNGKGGFAAGTPLILWDCAPATANMLWTINGI